MPETKFHDPEIIQSLGLAEVEMKTQRGMALQRPRDLKDAFEKALFELRAFPEFAEVYVDRILDRDDVRERLAAAVA